MASLITNVCGIQLENPFILASGILDENGYTMKKVMDEGASAVVTKSIGSEERTGYYPPVVVPLDYGMLNSVGLPNPGIDNYGSEIQIALKGGKPVIGSVFASGVKEFTILADKMESFGVSAIELNLSCPHVQGVGHEVGSDPALVRNIVETVKDAVSVPVIAKLSPNVSDMMAIVEAASEADAYTLINTVRGMKIDIRARAPVLSNVYGGLSGPAIKPVGVRYVYEVASNTEKPIIGVGGVASADDAIEYIMAGASAVQVGTAVSTLGKGIFGKLSSGMLEFMEDEGFSSLKEMRGVALRK